MGVSAMNAPGEAALKAGKLKFKTARRVLRHHDPRPP
jgi:hypothetical protein